MLDCPPWVLVLTGYGLGAMSRDGFQRLRRIIGILGPIPSDAERRR